jgi:hypothetical protein
MMAATGAGEAERRGSETARIRRNRIVFGVGDVPGILNHELRTFFALRFQKSRIFRRSGSVLEVTAPGKTAVMDTENRKEVTPMKRYVVAATTALMLLFLLTNTVGAQASTITPSIGGGVENGQPAMNADTDYGYYIWSDGDRIYLRTTDRGNGPSPSVYTGRIVVHNGDVRNVNVVRQESDDWAVASDNTVDYHFVTYNGIDGLDFTATGGEDVTFHLFRNGHLIVTEHIFLGAGQINPPGNPFTLFV